MPHHAAAGDGQQTRNTVDQRGFPHAGQADDTGTHAGGQVEIDIP